MTAVDAKLLEFEPRLGTIRHPGAVEILWHLLPELIGTDNDMRYAVFKLFEILSHLSHRNQAVLSSLGLLKRLFEWYYDLKANVGGSVGLSKTEKSVLLKLLKRLSDMGSSTEVARVIFKKAVREDESLDTDILDVIKFGMKSRWLEHLSLESPASLVLSEDGLKGLPLTGFSFVVSTPRFGTVSHFPSSDFFFFQ